MPKSRRRQILVDSKVQGALIARGAFYWFFCLMSVTMMVFCWTIYTGPPRPFIVLFREALDQYAPALIASFLLLPLVLVDLVRFSNRFTGPIYNLRGAMQKLARGESVPQLRFRQKDFWNDIAASFNEIAARVHAQPIAEEMDRSGTRSEDVAEQPEPATVA